MHLISDKKRKAPASVWTSAVCHQFRSIYFACGPLDQSLALSLGPGISMEFSVNGFYVFSALGTDCNNALLPVAQLFRLARQNLIGASKNSGWEHTMRWGNASKDSRWQNFYGAMLHQGRPKKMTLQLANFSASCVTLWQPSESSQRCFLEIFKMQTCHCKFLHAFWALIIFGETFRL
jgi:hypothetical protein